jgi:hypothetical protein
MTRKANWMETELPFLAALLMKEGATGCPGFSAELSPSDLGHHCVLAPTAAGMSVQAITPLDLNQSQMSCSEISALLKSGRHG